LQKRTLKVHLLFVVLALFLLLNTFEFSPSLGQEGQERFVFDPPQGRVGDLVTMTFSGFTYIPDQTVEILWDEIFPITTAELVDGKFSCTFRIPEKSVLEVPGTHPCGFRYHEYSFGAYNPVTILAEFQVTGPALIQPTQPPTEATFPTETPLPDNLPPGSDAFVGVLAALSGLRDFLGGNLVVLGGVVFVTGGLAVFLRHFLRSRRSSFTSPVGLAEMLPENPDDGVMVTSEDEGFIEFILRKIQEGGRMKVAEPENLPEMLKISEDEGFVDTVTKYLGKTLTDAERAAQDVANEIAGRFVRENPAWGSDSELQQKLAQDNKAELLRQVERELVADAGVAAVKAVRAAEKSKTLFGTRGGVPDSHFEVPGDDLANRAKQIGDGVGKIKDKSGLIDSYYDWKLPDGHDIADAAGGTYAKNEAAHKAYRVFGEQYGRGPSPDNYADVDVWNKIRENIESGEGE
jgi:hypothetical protein